MFRNFLKIIFRNIARNIGYVLLNVIGLGLALAICIVAYLNYKFDRDFDKGQEKRERIFRIEHTQLVEGIRSFHAETPVHLGPTVLEDIPGVEKMVRITKDLVGTLLRAGENEVYADLIYADPELSDIFTFPLISGNWETFRNNNSVFITERLAEGLFGDQDPVGKVITVWDTPFTVGGILENHPLNSSFQFNAVAPIQESFRRFNLDEMHWGNLYGTASTFILVADPEERGAIEKSLQQYVPAVNDANWAQVDRFYLAPFKDMAHQARSVSGHPFEPALHPAAVVPPIIAALFILLIACFNFINTTIAIAGTRLKEIGIRKVVGGLRRQLILQFMGENLILMVFALIFALFFARFLVPSYSDMWEFLDLSFSVTKDPGLWLFIVVTLVATALISGAYPALYISRFNPVSILRDKIKLGGSNMFLKVMLTLQFFISVLALFTGAAFIQNAGYQDRFDTGFEGASIFEVHGEDSDLNVLMDVVQRYPDIEAISRAIQGPFFDGRSIRYDEAIIDARMKFLELGSFVTLGYRLVEGRPFEPETQHTDVTGSILVNREFIDELGIQDPIGRTVLMSDTVPLTIIGVIENVLDEGSMTREITPVFYRLADESYKAQALYIRTTPQKRQQVQKYLKEEWAEMVPDQPFRGIEGDPFTEASEYINNRILAISVFLVIMANLLAAVGFYSQVSLRVIHRTKEIGIRKAFGASVLQVIQALNYEFLLILLLGSIAGITAGYFLDRALMGAIWEYYTQLSVLAFILPVLIIFAVSVITVSGRVLHAARRNPVQTLRYE